MNNGEKLTARILADARQAADACIAEAEQKKQDALQRSRAAADQAAAQIIEEAKQKAAAVIAAAETAGERTVRSALLRQRREELDAVMAQVLAQAKALPADAYFAKLLLLAKRAATGEAGVLRLDPADLQRMPDHFAAELKKLNITIDTAGAPMPDGGFVLCYGPIEINNRFGALAMEKKEALEDLISRQLFN